MTDTRPNTTTLGLALGGGAVKGLGHIGLLKLLDKHHIKPAHISGTSMGAIIGALYARGLSGEQIEMRVREHIILPGEKLKSIYQRRNKLVTWAKIFSYEKNKGGLITADGLFEHLFSELNGVDFDQMHIPFTAIATDLSTGIEHALSTGEVLSSVRASMAVPGVFAPVNIRVDNQEYRLVDGGLVNNVPTKQLQDYDVVLASDVICISNSPQIKTLAVLNNAINIMVRHATMYALEKYPADLVFSVDTADIEAFDFHKIDDVLLRGDQAAKKFEPELINLIKNKKL